MSYKRGARADARAGNGLGASFKNQINPRNPVSDVAS